MSFAPGQRWISHADTELGLGVVVGIEERRITLHFPAVEEDRTYASDNAPLSRLRLEVGDTLRTTSGERFRVEAVDDIDGLLIYRVQDGDEARQVLELELHPQLELETPKQRLLAGQTDGHAAFSLRLRTFQEADRLQRSGLRGLLGTRTALLPHQLYVASEVGKRHAPRVLLADEVGLGKTIEAGMILHRQLLTGASRRVLIIVPDSLQYQWLVEMRRRFNLAFSLFDEERLGEGQLDNPFESEQLVLCSLSLFSGNPLWRELALVAPWDLVVVDEAHRIHGGEGDDQERWTFLQELAQETAGLLLLTATPEQVGQEAHFGRLALLDPARFHDLEAFREEERRYREWNEVVEELEAGGSGAGRLPEGIDPALPAQEKIAQLIDRFGTGRVLFRNTRAAVGGFPRRIVRRRALSWPEAPRDSLYPELAFDEEQWLRDDPRVAWLIETLRELRPAKVLVICAHASTAVALESHLQLRAGIRAAAFHEGLSLIERDRAAAWFADAEHGAQTLLCSEIGSEGRNFQFAQHLVLFDLPSHPDQLEQRIGRLDRIGQGAEITLHLPYIEGTAQEVLLRWYDEGLNSLRESCSAGDMILQRFRERLQPALAGQLSDAALDALIDETAAFSEETRRELREGRDRLLERSSCDRSAGEALAEEIAILEGAGDIGPYLDMLCDVAGIDCEEHSEHCYILRRGEQERIPLFPELEDEGQTVTVSRDVALLREDMVFLGWEHPWLDGAMETLLHSNVGQCAVGALRLKGVPTGSRIYEFLFTTSVVAPQALQLRQYLPLSPQRIVIDGNGRDLTALLSHDKLQPLVEKLPRGTAAKVIKQLQGEIDQRLKDAEQLAAKAFESQRADARQALSSRLDRETARLKALRQLNPSVRPEEIAALEAQRDAGLAALDDAEVTLQAIRLVVTR